MVYLEYGMDNYWTGEKMVDHSITVALPIFRLAFPGMYRAATPSFFVFIPNVS